MENRVSFSLTHSEGNDRKQREQQALEVDLYEQIGRLKVELEWLKKKAARFA